MIRRDFFDSTSTLKSDPKPISTPTIKTDSVKPVTLINGKEQTSFTHQDSIEYLAIDDLYFGKMQTENSSFLVLLELPWPNSNSREL
ncbi:MAG: hypothetical protein IPQ03_08475 [Bacteroidetes bacterium]|nr:hypothetical protein [Bacteroidota bacterium]